jgi:two-component system CheB/CheR fusion protein
MNDELQRRGEDLNELNAFLEGIYASMRGGVVVLDCELRVLVWSAQSEEYWGLRSAEVMSASFLTLDIGLPVEALAGGIRAGLTGRRDVPRVRTSAVNRRGKPFELSVGFAPLLGADGQVRGVVLTMEGIDGGNVISPP